MWQTRHLHQPMNTRPHSSRSVRLCWIPAFQCAFVRKVLAAPTKLLHTVYHDLRKFLLTVSTFWGHFFPSLSLSLSPTFIAPHYKFALKLAHCVFLSRASLPSIIHNSTSRWRKDLKSFRVAHIVGTTNVLYVLAACKAFLPLTINLVVFSRSWK